MHLTFELSSYKQMSLCLNYSLRAALEISVLFQDKAQFGRAAQYELQRRIETNKQFQEVP